MDQQLLLPFGTFEEALNRFLLTATSEEEEKALQEAVEHYWEDKYGEKPLPVLPLG